MTKTVFDLSIDSNVFRWLKKLENGPSPASIIELLAGPKRLLRLNIDSSNILLNVVPSDGRCGYNLAAVFYHLHFNQDEALTTVNFDNLINKGGKLNLNCILSLQYLTRLPAAPAIVGAAFVDMIRDKFSFKLAGDITPNDQADTKILRQKLFEAQLSCELGESLERIHWADIIEVNI